MNDLSQHEREEDVARKIIELSPYGEITPEVFDEVMRYIFFKTVSMPEPRDIFESARIAMPSRFMYSADEAKRNLVHCTLSYFNNYNVSGTRIFEMRPEGAPLEYRFGRYFKIAIPYERGSFCALPGTEKGKFIHHSNIYRWMDTGVF